jgi:leader peptidase (prepilin peptidase)/N-methyltransferase
MIYALFFIFGLAIGSFLNLVIYRLDTGKSIIKTRSHCPYCKKTLSWFELIPLMSFILQKGKCTKCHKKISQQYPLVELATGILFVLCIWYFFPNFLLSAFYFLFSSILVIIFVYDLKHYIIPDQVIYPAVFVALIFNLIKDLTSSCSLLTVHCSLLNGLLAALAAGAFFLAIVLVSKGKWMGVGDIKLALFMGLVLGWPKILVALFLAFLIGAFASIILIILKKKTLKSEIPFGPFLAGGTIIAIFWGNVLINWYLGLMFL